MTPFKVHSPILDASGQPMIIGRIEPTPPGTALHPQWTHNPYDPTHKSWDRYCEWRRTKCRPRNLGIPQIRLEEMDEATHQFVGEVAELGQLIVTDGYKCLVEGGVRELLIDEIGDIFFCAVWLLDAYGNNPFRDNPSMPAPRDLQGAEQLDIAHAICSRLQGDNATGPLTGEETASLSMTLNHIVTAQLVQAGLLCNHFKKIRWQERAQDRRVMSGRVLGVLNLCAHLLAMIGANPEDALERNIEKLDARFPEGFVAPGGGIRTGKGA